MLSQPAEKSEYSVSLPVLNPDSVPVREFPRGGKEMSVARVTEITAASDKGFEDAVRHGLDRATQTLDNIKGAWIQDQEVVFDGNKITEFRVHMKVTFVLND
jgi:flavin-binding protein dodecin